MDFEEITSDFGEKLKNPKKNKVFLGACIVVGVVALFVWYRNQQTSTSTDSGSTLYYTGYPATGGGGGSGSDDYASQISDLQDYYSTTIESMADEYENQLSEVQSYYSSTIDSLADEYENQLSEVQSYYSSTIDSLAADYATTTDELQTNITTLSDQLRDAQEVTASLSAKNERQTLLSQMAANSELYNNISDSTQKAALHDANLSIAEKLGLTYDSKSGTYSDSDGNLAYKTALYTVKEQNNYSGSSGTKKTTGTVTYDNNTDYQKKIVDALMSGASASTVNSLNEQRNAKIKASGSTTAQANSGYDKNVDYSAAIAKAKASGASQQVINNLTAAREAKIKGENLNADGSKKKT